MCINGDLNAISLKFGNLQERMRIMTLSHQGSHGSWIIGYEAADFSSASWMVPKLRVEGCCGIFEAGLSLWLETIVELGAMCNLRCVTENDFMEWKCVHTTIANLEHNNLSVQKRMHRRRMEHARCRSHNNEINELHPST